MSILHESIWTKRIKWLRIQIHEHQIGIDATLMTDNIEQALRWDDEIRATKIWNLFVVHNPAFNQLTMP